MATSVVVDPTIRLEHGKAEETPVIIREEIKGLIRLHVDGKVERHPVVPCVPAESGDDVACSDVTIDEETNLRARLYVPPGKPVGPAIAYFHGGGFCVGSAAWSVYHEFAARLARETGRSVLSVEYRLAPESPLPAAYEDAARSVEWLTRRSPEGVVLAGDSAGANVVYNILSMASSDDAIRGAVLIQPFFGGEARTSSEAAAAPGGALSLAASDAYWRMALPAGASRDHRWCNPLSGGWVLPAATAVMVCVAELDILRDRNLEFCAALAEVRCEVYEGVGHAFQILGRSQLARTTSEVMMDHIKDFVSTC